MAKQWLNYDPVANLIIIDRSIYVMKRNVNTKQIEFEVSLLMNGRVILSEEYYRTPVQKKNGLKRNAFKVQCVH